MKNYKKAKTILLQTIEAAYKKTNVFIELKIFLIRLSNNKIDKVFNENRRVKNITTSLRKSTNSDIYKKVNLSKPKINIDFLHTHKLRPSFYMLAITIIVTGIVFSLIKNKGVDYEGYTEYEVETAKVDVNKSLELISKIFGDAKNVLTDDIIGEKISNPINKSINTVNNLFNEENRDEKTNN